MTDWTKLIGTIIGVVVLLAVVYYIYKWVVGGYDNTMAGEPWLIQGTKAANEMTIVPGNKLPLANDSQHGIEFSYGFWIFISQWTDASRRKDGYHHVLHRGDVQADPLQAPGVWLAPETNSLVVKLNTFSKITEKCQIANIPVKKWVHVSVVVINRYLDVYVNGNLKKRCLLRGLPRQNYGNVYINAFGGFNGFMSNVRYFNYALPLWKIDQIVGDGPSQMPCVDSGAAPPYLATDWWTSMTYPRS